VVDTKILLMSGPAIVTSDFNISLVYVKTSVRVEAKRWSSTICSRVMPGAWPLMYGTGFAGSLMYSSKPFSEGASKLSFPPLLK